MNKLYLFALTGMNYGNANTLTHDLTGEEWVINFIKRSSNNIKNFIFFDAGANAGNYSVLLANIFSATNASIYAFEPSKQSFAMLQNHTKHLKNIECFNFGFSNTEESTTIYYNYEGSGAITLYKDALNDFTYNKNLSEQISLKTIESFCADRLINKIDFLKIDVEGHELYVLLGGINMLKQKKIKFIQFEFGAFHIYSKTFFKDFWTLLSPLYSIFRIITDGIYEIKSYSENLEIFRTANFLAVLK